MNFTSVVHVRRHDLLKTFSETTSTTRVVRRLILSIVENTNECECGTPAGENIAKNYYFYYIIYDLYYRRRRQLLNKHYATNLNADSITSLRSGIYLLRPLYYV